MSLIWVPIIDGDETSRLFAAEDYDSQGKYITRCAIMGVTEDAPLEVEGGSATVILHEHRDIHRGYVHNAVMKYANRSTVIYCAFIPSDVANINTYIKVHVVATGAATYDLYDNLITYTGGTTIPLYNRNRQLQATQTAGSVIKMDCTTMTIPSNRIDCDQFGGDKTTGESISDEEWVLDATKEYAIVVTPVDSNIDINFKFRVAEHA